MSGKLVVYRPQGMNVAFKGVYTIPNIAVSTGNDPGPVRKGSVSFLIEFFLGDRLARFFLVSANRFVHGDSRSVFRERAQQRITELVHSGKLTLLIAIQLEL